MKRFFLFAFVLLLVFSLSVPSLAASGGIVLPSLPLEVAGYDMGYTDRTRFKITDIDYEINSNFTGSFDLKISLDGKKTYDADDDKEIRSSYIRVDLYNESGVRVASDRIRVGLKMVGFSFYSISTTFYSLSSGVYTLKFPDAIANPYYPPTLPPATPTPTPVPDLSLYLGTWYADDIWDGSEIHPLGAYAGATIRINRDRTFVFSIPSQTIYTGKWTIENDWFYVDNDTATESFFSSDHDEFFFDLFDGRYIVFFRYAPDHSNFIGTWYAFNVWDPDADEIYSLGSLAGAVLQINSDYTYAFYGSSAGDTAGPWSARPNRIYFDNDETVAARRSGDHLFYPLEDGTYLVFSSTPPANPTPTPTPTAEPTPAPTAAPTPAPTATPSPAPVILGDVNADGIVDGRDLLRLARYLAGHSVQVDFTAADLNVDGSLDGRDLLRLAKRLAGY